MSNFYNIKQEELEVVFDRGVESIQNNSFYYLIDICNSLNKLLENTETKDINDYLNLKYKQIIEALDNEITYAIEQLDKMLFNDVRYAKMSCCLKFLKQLYLRTSHVNRKAFDSILIRLNCNKHYLNCFVQFYSN